MKVSRKASIPAAVAVTLGLVATGVSCTGSKTEKSEAPGKTTGPAVAKLERREDVRLSTLRALIEAMGGQIEVRAIFPQGTVILRQPGESQAA